MEEQTNTPLTKQTLFSINNNIIINLVIYYYYGAKDFSKKSQLLEI